MNKNITLCFRKAQSRDIEAITKIYNAIHDEEEAGKATIGWMRGVYPTSETAKTGILSEDMYVAEFKDIIVGAARINHEQMPAYRQVSWRSPAPDNLVMVMHTLVVDPEYSRKGIASQFAKFYEYLSNKENCPYLRIDTNERNVRARMMYRKLGFEERAIVPCEFNGIPGVGLVCLEKNLQKTGKN